jgi:hypothetical protein
VVSKGQSKRTRGPNKTMPWMRRPEDGLSVLRLPLDMTDPVQRRRIEAMFSSAYAVRRAVQRDARDRSRAYRSARHERARDAAAVRERLGLTRTALEHAAYAHLDAAPHLRRAVTKALAMHLADSVWSATERHLFRDAAGARHGMPRPGEWLDFTRLPGRARSHRTERKWETFRLHGTLDGHRAAYTRADGRFAQPDHLRPIAVPSDGWWSYTGPLAVVFTGLPIGTLVLPVRLPPAPCNQGILDHHLADPARWHKIDLVRHRDPTAVGRWRYEAHLMVLAAPYVAPAVQARRVQAAATTADLRAGIDVNVSNLTIASHADGGDLRITKIVHDASARRAIAVRGARTRRRQRRLDRSRRASNPDQYGLSPRQQAHNARREAAGLPAVQMIPRGPRKRRANGTPETAYRRDALSRTYRRERAAEACEAAATSQARRDLARQLAARLVRDHGYTFVIEDCDLRPWARAWGRRLSAFTPGLLVTALESESAAVAQLAGRSGVVERASTRTTALSQHCLCGQRVAKSLRERTHGCTACGLRGDRDAVAATLAACVILGTAGEPASATVDSALARALLDAPHTRARLFATLPYGLQGRQDVRSESTVHSARDGWFVAEKGPTPDLVVVARRIVGTASYPTLDERGGLGRCTTRDRVRTRTNLSGGRIDDSLRLRDSS